MAKIIKSVPLSGVRDLGAIHFLRAEWWREESRAVLIRYSCYGNERGLGLRLDMDKKAILDPLNDAEIALEDELVRERTEEIWQIVANARSKDKAFAA